MKPLFFVLVLVSYDLFAGPFAIHIKASEQLTRKYDEAFKKLDEQSKLVNKYYQDIKNCIAASDKSFEEERSACGSKGATAFVAQKKSTLEYLVKQREKLNKEYEDLIASNPSLMTNGAEGPSWVKNPESVSEAMSYLDGKIKLQDARFSLEQKISNLEAKLNEVTNAYKNYFNDKALCQKVANCSAVKRASKSANDALDALKAINSINDLSAVRTDSSQNNGSAK